MDLIKQIFEDKLIEDQRTPEFVFTLPADVASTIAKHGVDDDGTEYEFQFFAPNPLYFLQIVLVSK